MFARYAIYFVPEGAWGEFGANWLGWDSRVGRVIAPKTDSQEELTQRPRKYGFHATMKPPFALKEGTSVVELAANAAAMCAKLSPFDLASLQVSQIGRFFALTAPEEESSLSVLASQVVREFDRFRAAPSEEELARRRRARLTERQDALLTEWGYPFVMEEFRFHMTLTGPVQQADAVKAELKTHLEPVMQQDMLFDSLSLLGEAQDGRFHQIQRFPFMG